MNANMSNTSSYFIDYEEDSLDPGWSFVVGSLIACILLNATLPCLVSLGSRYERRRNGSNFKSSEDSTDDEGEELSGSSSHGDELVIVDMAKVNVRDAKLDESGPDENKMNLKEQEATTIQYEMKEVDESDIVLVESKSSEIVLSNALTTACFGGSSLSDWFSGFADTILIPSYQDDHKANVKMNQTKAVAPSVATQKTNASKVSSSVFGGRPRRQPGTSSNLIRRQNSRVAYKLKPSPSIQQSSTRSKSGAPHSSSVSQAGSVMSRLHQDDVSFNEAIDSYSPIRYQLPNEDTSGEIDILFGEQAWWKPAMIAGGFDRIVGIADWDEELEALFKTALPFSLQSFATGFFNILDVALVGHFVSAAEANVFVVVSLLTWITSTLNYGFCEALGKTVPAALGNNNNKMAGVYFNTSLTLYSLGIIPIALIWSLGSKATFLWLGFDQETAQIAQEYAYLQVMIEWVTGIDYCFHLFLDIIGHETYSTYTMFGYNIGQTLGVVIPILAGQNNLVWVGVCRVGFSCCLLFANGITILCLGWMKPYISGFLEVPLSDWEIVKTVTSMSGPLGAAYFLTYGEWELLAFFASALGPAELVAWGMLGYIWSMLKYLSDGIADAAEMRCALYLVSNQPELARLCAYKSLFLGLASSLFVTSILFMLGEVLVPLITPDETLQRLMIELFPLLGMGNIVMTTGIISWALVGAQGRYRQATIVQFICNWGVTIPLSVLFTYGLRIDLQGLTSAFLLGLALSGAGNSYILIRSQWQRFATIISEENQFDEAGYRDPSVPAQERRNKSDQRSSSMLDQVYDLNQSNVSADVSVDSRQLGAASF